MKNLTYNFSKKLLFIIFLSSIFSSCITIKLISEYDEIADKTINSLQEDVSRILINVESNLGTEKAQYINYSNSYEDIRVKLKILNYRVNALEKNKILLDQVIELTKIVDNIEKFHKIGFQNKEQLDVFNQPLESAFGAMTKLQIALKRGDKQASK